ncbi:MAG: hypothetical protein IPJ47_17445 [Anaerolineales bacterium]|nr:hypothetical protein [Anaerolineales bacterium]
MAGLKDVVTPTSVATNTPTATIAPQSPTQWAAAAPAVAGTNSTAGNYNSAATWMTAPAPISVLHLWVLLRSNAINYNPNANADDGSCGYPAPIITVHPWSAKTSSMATTNLLSTVNWKPADPGLNGIARTTVGMLNGKEVYKSGTSMKVSA